MRFDRERCSSALEVENTVFQIQHGVVSGVILLARIGGRLPVVIVGCVNPLAEQRQRHRVGIVRG